MNNYNKYLPPNPEALKQIKHIVVLMMENRSFDNMLGWLYDGEVPNRGQYFEGLKPDMWNPLDNFDANGRAFVEKIQVRKNGKPYTLGRKSVSIEENFCLPDPDPGEGYADTTDQLFGTYEVDNLYPPAPTAMGYVNNYMRAMQYGAYSYQNRPVDPREIMTCFTPRQTPVLSALAKGFAVLDQYFCSVPSQTLPNRDFVHAATSNGYVNNQPNNQVMSKTIYNQIQEKIDSGKKELSWAIYSGLQQDKKTKKWLPFSLTRLCMVKIQDEKYNDNFKLLREFYQDAASGNLPSYSFLEPQFSGPFQNDQHPPKDIRPGEKLMADLYNALRKSPKWKETLFIITYDEHGGTYDHYPPNARATSPDKVVSDGQMNFRFNRFGVRVPTVVISPLIEEGTIGRPAGYVPFDHTSIIKTVQNCLGLTGHLTERDKVAPDLSCLLTRTKARKTIPSVKPRPFRYEENTIINDLQRLITDILGTKLNKVISDKKQGTHQAIHENYKHLFYSKLVTKKS